MHRAVRMKSVCSTVPALRQQRSPKTGSFALEENWVNLVDGHSLLPGEGVFRHRELRWT